MKWDDAAKYVIATDVPSTELDRWLKQLPSMSHPFGGSRQPAWQITRMDVVNYRASRVMARKGKRRHPTEREWQRVLAEQRRTERLANAGRKQRDRNVEIDARISAYIKRHKED